MRAVAVFDTNVWLSEIGWKGPPFQCLEHARSGDIEAVTCAEIVEELTEKLETRLGFSAERVAETLADILSFSRMVEIANELHTIAADPDDDKILECAVKASATHIVSGDHRHLLPLGMFRGIAIVTPSDFLCQLMATS